MRGLFLAILLTGCASAPLYHHWTKPGFAEQQFNADWYQCAKENTSQGTTVENIGGSIEVHRTQDANDTMVIQCMKARGYTLTGTDNKPN